MTFLVGATNYNHSTVDTGYRQQIVPTSDSTFVPLYVNEASVFLTPKQFEPVFTNYRNMSESPV